MNAVTTSQSFYKRQKNESDQYGYIYILAHKSGRPVKVGETRVSPEARLKDYSKTYKLKDFDLFKTYKVPLDDRKKIEKMVHSYLNSHQLSCLAGAKEIFNCDTGEAIRAIEHSIAKNTEALRLLKIENERRAEVKKLDKARQQEELKQKILEEAWEKSPEYQAAQKRVTDFLKSNPLETKKIELIDLLVRVCLGCFMTLMFLGVLMEPDGGMILAAIISSLVFSISGGFSSTKTLVENKENVLRHDYLLKGIEAEKRRFFNGNRVVLTSENCGHLVPLQTPKVKIDRIKRVSSSHEYNVSFLTKNAGNWDGLALPPIFKFK